ncbi:DUF2232 domain-containing protein [Trichothermofontia sichuanensis B231]|uniref:DUF2232 domain-containing protein n=1 Tax=Trichothermofontia sichuanensis TaxID=3045816 RepID=UPI00224694A6|nr:DUF2232 domain-containing protein [Trichothermofontia sichuanensis]UZQ55496.1 DUF2232 domain-containing protein [Trichothermofontia sichuanensis B231]
MSSSPNSRDLPLASSSDRVSDEEIPNAAPSPAEAATGPVPSSLAEPHLRAPAPLSLVETAFLASTASLIWLVNYYFPIGPLLRIFFPLPITLVYLRWGHRATWMATLVSGLLLSVLMGPTRSILFIVPFGLLGVLLGWLWRNAVNWWVAIALGTLLNTVGFFFRIWLVSLLLGDDLWAYSMVQIANLAEWIFTKLGILTQPDLWLIQVIAVAVVVINSVIYLFVVHLAAWLLLERLGSSIPAPPEWVQVLLDIEASE